MEQKLRNEGKFCVRCLWGGIEPRYFVERKKTHEVWTIEEEEATIFESKKEAEQAMNSIIPGMKPKRTYEVVDILNAPITTVKKQIKYKEREKDVNEVAFSVKKFVDSHDNKIQALSMVGKENGIDVNERWGHLSNPGLVAMSLTNVLKNKFKKGETILVNGVKVE